MIIDSPYWVKHGDGDGISGLDVSPNGRRLATCGSAPQIVIWNMLPILDERAEQDASVPKILATIQDSSGSVLTVRFSHCGSMLAAGCGGDADSAVLIFKQSSVPATQTLGMGGSKLPNIENWRPVATLRGHSLDVTALSWSPGDEFLASASMDGNVHIWGMNPDGRGRLVHSFDGQHKGWVKGLAFDPIGRYLATQGRNGVKVWDVSCGWALVTHQRRPFERSPDAGFRYKTSWSPDGEVLIAMNGAEAKHLCICSFSRQTWELHEMVGHRGAVLVSAANPRLFYPPVQLLQQRMTEADEQQEEGDAEQQQERREGSSVGGSKPATAAGEAVAYSDEACTVFAAGSNDKSITLWCSPLPRPLLQVSQIHGGGIVDMAWTPDGYTLIAASLDDRVSVMRFARCELGRAVSDEEFRQMIATEYGPAGAAADGQAAGAAAAGGGGTGAADIDTQEDAELAALAGAAAAAAAGPDEPERAFPTPPRPAVQPALAAAAPVRPAPAAAGARPAAAGGSALDRRLMPQGNGVTTGTLAQRPAAAQQQLQQVGQKRLHPTSVGANPAAAAAAAAAGSGGGALHPAKRAHTGAQSGQQQQQRQLQQQAGSRSAAAAGSRVGGGGGWVLPPPGVAPVLEVQVALVTVQRPDAPQQVQQDQYQSVTLLVENRRGPGTGGSGAARAAGGAEVSLHLGGMPGHVFWRDRLQEQVVAAAGNLYFTAAATPSGLLYTWRSKGTPLLPPLALGCPPVSLSAEGPWSLLVVGSDGGLLTLDLSKKQREFSGPAPAPNLAPILAASAPGTSLMDAWVTAGSSSSSSSGQQPLPSIGRTQVAVLSDGSGWLFHPGLGLWVMLKLPAAGPGGQPGPAPLPVVAAVGGSADADRLQARAGGTPFTPGLQQAVSQGGPDSFAARQAAYWQLTAAELLHDAVGYQRWLGQLVNLLARQRDLERLKELCEDLLGPARWDPSMLPAAAGGRPGCEVCEWTPTLLGLDKRTMLAQLVIPALAQERLPLAKEVNAHLQAANAHTQRAAAAMAAAAAAAQAAAAAAAGVGAGMGAPAAAGAVGYPLPLFPDLRLGVRQSVSAAAGGQGAGDAATAPATGADTHGLQEHTLHGLESGAQSGGTAAPHQPGMHWQQQTDTGSGVAGLSGPRAHTSAMQQQQQQPDAMDSHQQQQMVVAANGHTANGVGPGAAPRRLQATPVIAPQQQQQELRGTTPGVSGEALGRIPLQEQQQPHSLTPQHTPGKQQQHSADKGAAAAQS